MPPQTDSSVIFHHAVSFLLLIISHRGQSQVIGQPQPIVATVGDDITLPCHVEPATDADQEMLEWSRTDLKPRFVHVRRSGEDRLIDQNPSYKGRTSTSIDRLRQGDMSLTLSHVKVSDEGTYRCFSPRLNTDCSVQLVVGASSSAVISLSGIDEATRGVMLDCRSEGWYPEPEVLWLDGEGNLLSAGPPETVRGPDDLYTVSSRVTVEKRHSNSFTCRVHQKNTNQTRDTHIQVPDDTSTTSAIVGVIVGILFILAVAFIVWKWRQNRTKTNKDNEDEESQRGGERKRNSMSNDSEQESLIERETNTTERETMMNQYKMEGENNTQCLSEERRRACQIETEEGKINTIIMLRTKDKTEVETMNNRDEDSRLISKETQAPGPTERETQPEKPNTERTVEDQMDGDGQQLVGRGGGANHDLDNRDEEVKLIDEQPPAPDPPEGGTQPEQPVDTKSINDKTTAPGPAETELQPEQLNTQNVAEGQKDGDKQQLPVRTGGDSKKDLDNKEEETKSVSEETSAPNPAERETQPEQPNTERTVEDQMDGDGQQLVRTGGGANNDLDNRDEEVKLVDEQPPAPDPPEGGTQPKQPVDTKSINDRTAAPGPAEGGKHQEESKSINMKRPAEVQTDGQQQVRTGGDTTNNLDNKEEETKLVSKETSAEDHMDGQQLQLITGGEAKNNVDNRDEETKSVSEETSAPNPAERETQPEQPDTERTVEDQMDGDGQQQVRTGGDATNNLDNRDEEVKLIDEQTPAPDPPEGGTQPEQPVGTKSINDKTTAPGPAETEPQPEQLNTQNVAEGQMDGDKQQLPVRTGGDSKKDLDNKEEETKSVSEETSAPNPAERETQPDNRDEETKSISEEIPAPGPTERDTQPEKPDTERTVEDQMDGDGQQLVRTGGGPNHDLDNRDEEVKLVDEQPPAPDPPEGGTQPEQPVDTKSINDKTAAPGPAETELQPEQLNTQNVAEGQKDGNKQQLPVRTGGDSKKDLDNKEEETKSVSEETSAPNPAERETQPEQPNTERTVEDQMDGDGQQLVRTGGGANNYLDNRDEEVKLVDEQPPAPDPPEGGTQPEQPVDTKSINDRTAAPGPAEGGKHQEESKSINMERPAEVQMDGQQQVRTGGDATNNLDNKEEDTKLVSKETSAEDHMDGQQLQLITGGEAKNNVDNRDEETKSVSEETPAPGPTERETQPEQPDTERTVEGQMDGDGQQLVRTGGGANNDLDIRDEEVKLVVEQPTSPDPPEGGTQPEQPVDTKSINDKTTTGPAETEPQQEQLNTHNVADGQMDGDGQQQVRTGGDSKKDWDNRDEEVKLVVEQPTSPDPPEGGTQPELPVDTKSINDKTAAPGPAETELQPEQLNTQNVAEGQKDGDKQQLPVRTGGDSKKDLDNKEEETKSVSEETSAPNPAERETQPEQPNTERTVEDQTDGDGQQLVRTGGGANNDLDNRDEEVKLVVEQPPAPGPAETEPQPELPVDTKSINDKTTAPGPAETGPQPEQLNTQNVADGQMDGDGQQLVRTEGGANNDLDNRDEEVKLVVEQPTSPDPPEGGTQPEQPVDTKSINDRTAAPGPAERGKHQEESKSINMERPAEVQMDGQQQVRTGGDATNNLDNKEEDTKLVSKHQLRIRRMDNNYS